ncbi:hypothetical protein BN946_scf184979.g3 [Trametes cinnabarina]|uniref:RMT2 domain-containing protein n=1 Tax=Pycnoporus cinnabarinus TaxID=5643 RepID=A0A060SPT2_PYCCI|nr:hypothetical protein BN946_scf184979.g3 [Trametes cinnabarina]
MAEHSDQNSTHEDVDMDVDAIVAQGQELIDAILRRRLPVSEIKSMIEVGAPVWFQDDDGNSPLHAAAYVESEELVRLLIDEGAIWNADVALSLNNEKCYTIVRDAGIRSELLLTLLQKRAPAANSPLNIILKATDSTPAGSTDAFLSTRLEYTKDEHGQEICLVKVADQDEVGVMMGWERGISQCQVQETVRRLCADHENPNDGLKVLNVGFGLGISLSPKPSLHVIIEPHPDVLAHMREQGWHEKPGVKILEGKWQDFVESEELLAVGGFDVIYTDTFSEDYADLLAGPESRFSFFNGLGATNATFYDVYTHVSELHLADVGIDVEWSDVDVFEGDTDRWGKTREYFAMRTYRLPVGRMRTL